MWRGRVQSPRGVPKHAHELHAARIKQFELELRALKGNAHAARLAA